MEDSIDSQIDLQKPAVKKKPIFIIKESIEIARIPSIQKWRQRRDSSYKTRVKWTPKPKSKIRSPEDSIMQTKMFFHMLNQASTSGGLVSQSLHQTGISTHIPASGLPYPYRPFSVSEEIKYQMEQVMDTLETEHPQMEKVPQIEDKGCQDMPVITEVPLSPLAQFDGTRDDLGERKVPDRDDNFDDERRRLLEPEE